MTMLLLVQEQSFHKDIPSNSIVVSKKELIIKKSVLN